MKKALLLLAAALLTAQTTKEVEITAEPHHHKVLENQYVRVFNVDVPAHADTLMHRHRHDYAFVMLGPSHVSNDVKGKAPVELRFPDGETHFSPGPFAHIARNLSDEPFRNVTIEYLQDETLRKNEKSNTAKLDATRGLDILHGGTSEILFVNDGVRATEFELQPGGMVPLHHHQGPHLLIAISDLDLQEEGAPGEITPGKTTPEKITPGKATMKMNEAANMPGHLMSGDSKWIPGNYSHSITNKARTPAKFVTLEFPPSP